MKSYPINASEQSKPRQVHKNKLQNRGDDHDLVTMKKEDDGSGGENSPAAGDDLSGGRKPRDGRKRAAIFVL